MRLDGICVRVTVFIRKCTKSVLGQMIVFLLVLLLLFLCFILVVVVVVAVVVVVVSCIGLKVYKQCPKASDCFSLCFVIGFVLFCFGGGGC